MSNEAVTYVKTMDLGKAECPAARLLLYVIAENLYNDSGVCKVGQSELVYQTRSTLRSVQRHAAILSGLGSDGKPPKLERPVITITRRARRDGKGRLRDAIGIVGFQEWLEEQRAQPRLALEAHEQAPEIEQPANLAPCHSNDDESSCETPVNKQPATLASCSSNPLNEGGENGSNPPDEGGATRQQVAAIYKEDSRTSVPVLTAKRARAKATRTVACSQSNHDLDVKSEALNVADPKKPKREWKAKTIRPADDPYWEHRRKGLPPGQALTKVENRMRLTVPAEEAERLWADIAPGIKERQRPKWLERFRATYENQWLTLSVTEVFAEYLKPIQKKIDSEKATNLTEDGQLNPARPLLSVPVNSVGGRAWMEFLEPKLSAKDIEAIKERGEFKASSLWPPTEERVSA